MPRRIITHYGTTLTALCATAAMVTAVAVIEHRANTAIRAGQVDACERGNVIRALMAEDNAETIRTLRARLEVDGITADERDVLRDALDRRTWRQAVLTTFPCDTLR